MPKFKNRAERRAWLDSHVTSFDYVPAGYEPEPWDVVKDGTLTVVRHVGIGPADDACAYLNAHNRPHSYKVVPSRESAGAE